MSEMPPSDEGKRAKAEELINKANNATSNEDAIKNTQDAILHLENIKDKKDEDIINLITLNYSLENFAGVIEIYKKNYPSITDHYVLRKVAASYKYQRKSDSEEARVMYEHTLSICKTMLEESKDKEKGEIFLTIALCQVLSKNYIEAIETYEEAIAASASETIVLYDIALCYFELKDYKTAIKKFEAILESDNNKGEILKNIGDCYFDLKDYNTAIKKYEDAIKEDADKIRVLIDIANCHFNSGYYETAIDKYNDAINQGADKAKTLESIGLCYFELKQYETAISTYRNIININGDKKRALLNIITCYLNLKKYEKAIKEYKDGVNKGIKIEELRKIFYCHIKSNTHEEFLQEYEKKINEMQEDKTKDLIKIGDFYCQLKNYQKAIKKYQEANEKVVNKETLFPLGVCHAELHKQTEDNENKVEHQQKALKYLSEAKLRYKGIDDYINKALEEEHNFKNITAKNKKSIEAIEAIESIAKLLVTIQEIRDEHPNKTILFRGHENKNWPLKPTVYRDDDYELETFESNFKINYPNCFQKELTKTNKIEIKAEMQHYGIPTDLLDWSTNPLVSMCFALCKNQNFKQTPVTDVCLWVAVCDKLELCDKTEEAPAEEIKFYATPISNPRIAAQKGCFSHTSSKLCLTELVTKKVNKNKGIKLYQLCLANDFSGGTNKEHKEELENLGMTPLQIYPDHEGLKHEIIGYSKKLGVEEDQSTTEEEIVINNRNNLRLRKIIINQKNYT